MSNILKYIYHFFVVFDKCLIAVILKIYYSVFLSML